jgi:hypothetical protein
MTRRVAIVLEGQVLRNAYSVVFHNMVPSIEARIHMRDYFLSPKPLLVFYTTKATEPTSATWRDMPHHGTRFEDAEKWVMRGKTFMRATQEHRIFRLLSAVVNLSSLVSSNKSDVLPRTASFFSPLRLCSFRKGSLNRLHGQNHNLRNSQHTIFPSGHSVRLNPKNFGELRLRKAQCLSFSFQRCAIHWTSHPTFWGTKRSIRKVYSALDATIH